MLTKIFILIIIFCMGFLIGVWLENYRWLKRFKDLK